MGFKTEFNWVLKLKKEQGLYEDKLKQGLIYEFSKKEERIYPINVPIDLINENWEAVAKIIIVECKQSNGKTEGKYKVIKIYKGKEKEILTGYWRENIEIIKNEKITDFSNIKLT